MQAGVLAIFIHVLFGFTAVALLIVPGLICEMAAHTTDVVFIRKLFQISAFHGRLGGPIALLTGILGLVAAWLNGIPLNSGWLIAAYITFVALFAIGSGFHGRYEIRVGMLAAACPDDKCSPELLTAIHNPLCRPMFLVSLSLWVFMIFLMVTKPF
jgi:hypothetical protein